MIIGAACMVSGCAEEEGRISTSPVKAEFTADATDVLAGRPVAFTDQSTGDVHTWSWIFEGGTPDKSHVQNPAVAYTKPGTYEVTLVVSNVRYTDKMVKTGYITVTAAPQPITAKFDADKTSILSGESVTFTSNSEGNPDTWEWELTSDLGASLEASGQNPSVTFEEPGIYTVKLTASNSAYSDEEVKENYITVVDPSSVAAEFTADAKVVYEGQQVQFTDISVGTVTDWKWTFEGGTPASSTDQNPVVTYATTGSYKVTLEVSNATNSSTKEQVAFISVIPGNDLVTLLTFDGKAEDRGPLTLPVNTNGSVSFAGSDRHNQSSSMAGFDGASVISIPASPDKQFGAASYSVGVWIKTTVPSRMMIWEEGGGGAGTPQAWFRINDNASTSLYRLNTNTGGHLQVSVDDGGTSLSDGQWHYIVCIRDVGAGKSRMYVDGVLMKEINNTATDITNDQGFRIGGQLGAGGSFSNLYTGEVDDLVIYKRVLSEDEVKFLSGL